MQSLSNSKQICVFSRTEWKVLNGFSDPYMKARMRSRNAGAMTAFEVLAVIVCLLIAASMLLWLLARAGPGLHAICARAIRHIDMAFRVCQGDNMNQFQMTVSAANGGAMEPIETGNLSAYFQLASNGLRTPKIFIYPADQRRTFATNWNYLNNSNMTCFASRDVTHDNDPGLIINGDDNYEFNGSPVKSGLFELPPNGPVQSIDQQTNRIANP